jgi:hypothetical protein
MPTQWDGTIASLDATGHTELNAPVDEHFTLRNGRASWNSREERGEKDLIGPAYFIPNSSTDSDAFLVAALRKRSHMRAFSTSRRGRGSPIRRC